jgi:glycosyltransferase involved in cell wall biosynthesis
MISVVIPTYNARSFLREAIDSVIAERQRGISLEIIISDDCSTDDSVAIARSYGDAVRIISAERNGGGAAARNRGIRAATGDFIALLDCDDLCLPGRFVKGLKAIEETGADLVFSDVKILGDEEGPTWLEIVGSKNILSQKTEDGVLKHPLDLLCEFGNFILPSTVLVKRNVFTSAGDFNEKIMCADDYEFFARVAAKGTLIAFIAEPLALRRVHGGNLSQNWRRRYTSELLTIETIERLPNLSDSSKKNLKKWEALLHRQMAALELDSRDFTALRRELGESLASQFSFKVVLYAVASYIAPDLLYRVRARKAHATHSNK